MPEPNHSSRVGGWGNRSDGQGLSAGMRRAQEGSIRFLRLLMAASIALPCLLFGFASWITYQSAYSSTDGRIERSLAILEEHANYLFRSTDILLSSANVLLGSLSDDEIRRDESQYHVVLEQLTARLPQVLSLWIFDAQGRPVISSRTYPVPNTFSNFDRDYFQAQMKGDAGLFIGGIVNPKVPGEAIFGVSRRRPGADFRGVVAVAIRPSELQDFYKAMGSEGSYAALLRASDGAFLGRQPAPVALGLKLSEASSTRRAIATGRERAILTINSETDGVNPSHGLREAAPV